MEVIIKRVYWDSCTFLALINSEAGKHRESKAVWAKVVSGEYELITSFFSLTEVFKAKCEGTKKPLSEEGEDAIAKFFEGDRILGVPVDRRTSEFARKLMRRHPECKKPTDAIHLATATLMNVDEMHTFDGADLLSLNGKVAREDGEMLVICTPYVEDPGLDL